MINGDRKFLKGNGGGVSKTNPPELNNIDLQYIQEFDLLHTSIHSYIEDQLPLMHKVSKFLSMDFSDCYDTAYLKKCCLYADCAEISCGNMEK